MKKDKHSADIKEVAKDIIEIKFDNSKTLKECMGLFFDIMRKHGIKQGTPVFDNEGKEVGTTLSNYEWSLCTQMFYKQIESFLTIEMLFGKNIPEELKK
jgi:hypothetical protein